MEHFLIVVRLGVAHCATLQAGALHVADRMGLGTGQYGRELALRVA